MATNVLLSTVPLLPLYLGIYLLFLMRNDFDLTLAGTYSVGGAVTAMMLTHGSPVSAAMGSSVLAAALLGLVTATMHSRLRIPVFLGGLIMSITLYTVVLRIMDKKPTVSLIGTRTILQAADSATGTAYYTITLGILGGVALVSLALVGLFLKTELGLALRASGVNALMARNNGYNDKVGVATALAIGNALAGLSGALMVQTQGFATASGGESVLIGGLGGVVIGALVVRPDHSTVLRMLVAVAGGGLVYQTVVVLALRLGLDPVDLNLVTGATLVVAIAGERAVRKVISGVRGRDTGDFRLLDDALAGSLTRGVVEKG